MRGSRPQDGAALRAGADALQAWMRSARSRPGRPQGTWGAAADCARRVHHPGSVLRTECTEEAAGPALRPPHPLPTPGTGFLCRDSPPLAPLKPGSLRTRAFQERVPTGGSASSEQRCGLCAEAGIWLTGGPGGHARASLAPRQVPAATAGGAGRRAESGQAHVAHVSGSAATYIESQTLSSFKPFRNVGPLAGEAAHSRLLGPFAGCPGKEPCGEPLSPQR